MSSLRPVRGFLAVAVVVGVVWTGAKVAIPGLIQRAIDDGIEAGDDRALARWGVAIAVAALIQAVCAGVRRLCSFTVARRVEARLRDDLFAHLQKLHFAYHDGAQTGNLMSRANTDLNQVQAFLVMIPLTLSNGLAVLLVAAACIAIDPLLTVAALGVLPLSNVLARRFSQRLHPEVLAIQEESAQLASVVEETVSGIRAVKGFGAESRQWQRFRREVDDVYEASMAATRVRAAYVPALDLLPNIGLIVTLAYGGHQVLAGELTVGRLVAFNVYLALLVWPLRVLGWMLALGQRAVASAQRVHEVLRTDVEVLDPVAPEALPATGGSVALRSVTFRYPSGRGGPPVLDGLDLTIAAGESVAIVGATGSGKSTLARLLPRFYDVDSGAVLLDGVDVRQLRLHDLRAAIGIVFEDTFLFSDTIAANIAFAVPDAPLADVVAAARLAGAHDFIEALPEGYATEIGERGFSLSGGQRQRIAIARAILADPRVLILDDATSAVDPSKETEIREAMATVMAGRTTLVIAHRPATVALADRVVLLDGGRIVASGTHQDLLATDARYREVLAAEPTEVGPTDIAGRSDDTDVPPEGRGAAAAGGAASASAVRADATGPPDGR